MQPMRPYFRLQETQFRLPHAAPAFFDPDQLAGLYSFPVNLTGSAKAVGIIELGGGYHPSDVQAAFAGYHLPMPVLNDISINGGRNSPGQDADIEVLLDIQIAAAVYSYCTNQPAHILTYFAPNTNAGFSNAVAQAARDGCATISISWGSAEANFGTVAATAFSNICRDAVASGSTVFAASGDDLSNDGTSGAAVDFPASSPFVIGCGGTSKTAGGETVWNSGGGGTGGGFSNIFPTQAYQIGVPTGPGRMVPDVAGNADPQTGWRIFANGKWIVVGGTSAVAPMYAGLFAALSLAAGRKLGSVHSSLYQHPAAFSDITVGNNGQWRALVGPDPCTGLGVPIGSKLVSIFAPAPPIVPPAPTPVPIPPPLPTWTAILKGTGLRPVDLTVALN